MNKSVKRPPVKRRPLLHTAPETAQKLSMSERKLRDLTKSGQIAHIKVGGSIRYSMQDIEAFIERSRVSA